MHIEEIKLDLCLSHKRKDSILYMYKNLTRVVNLKSRTLITVVSHITIYLVIIAIEDVSIQNNNNKMRNYLNFYWKQTTKRIITQNVESASVIHRGKYVGHPMSDGHVPEQQLLTHLDWVWLLFLSLSVYTASPERALVRALITLLVTSHPIKSA